MRVIVKKNPVDCVELSLYLGHPVASWDKDGKGNTVAVDIPGELTAKQQKAIEAKISSLPNHLAFTWEA